MLDTRAFAKFLESQPPEMPYTWVDRSQCPIGQFFAERGEDYMKMAYADEWEIHITSPAPHTYGGAAQRAKELV